ncbi:hypothetical protein ACFWCB_05745 [Streptomyces sp. NPDC060048]|uniref:hypothetical protein n=1 Tax=unclassified Streptomyces TaxID=2593676 RepID=UPI0036838EF6
MAQLGTNFDERLARLKAGLSDDPKVSRSVDRLRLRRPANVLAGVTLHAAARQEQGLELTELEESLLRMLRGAISDEEIAAAGKAYQEAAPAALDQVFPDVVGRLAVQDPYTLADLGRDLTTLLPGILAQPNVNIVDVTTLAEGQPVDDESFLEAMAATGSGATVLTAPLSQEVPDSLVLPTTLALKRFTCVRSTGDQWNSSDEIYWMCAAGADSNARSTYASPQYGDVDSGESRDFPAGAHLFHGEVGHHLMTNIQCWERDQGDVFGELRARLRDVADACATAAVSIIKDGEKQEAALAAVIAVVAALLDWLLGWLSNDDDLVGERSVAYTRAGLQALNGKDTVLDFTGNGHYKLTFGCQTQPLRQPTASTQVVYRKIGIWDNGEWSATQSIGLNSPFGPAQAPSFNLYFLAVTDSSKQWLHGRQHDNSSIGTWWSLKADCGASPALARHSKDTIYAFRGKGTDRAVYWGVVNYSGADPNKFPDITSGYSPTLYPYKGALHCVVAEGSNGRLMHASATDGTNWSPFTPIGAPFKAVGSPALVEFNGTLYCVYPANHGEQFPQLDGALTSMTFDGTRWSNMSSQLPGPRKTAPGAGVGLAVKDRKLWCAVRGPEGDQGLYWATYDGTTWSAFTKIAGAWSADTPSLAYWDGNPAANTHGIYLTYRGPGTK